MTSSFHQIELEKESRKLTAFSTNKGHYQFKRLPFGLKISTNSFQRMLSIALCGLDADAFIYVDDIIIFGCSVKHHNEKLIKVFERLRKHNLKLNPEKCNLLKPEVTYLGHLITPEGIRTDPNKHATIRDYPAPKSAEETLRFIAFCNYYRRFIPDFAKIARPLNSLLKKNQLFQWNDEHQQAFENLKAKLINPPILQYPDFSKPFILTTDASDYALGAVLSQGEIGSDLPITYASRSLKKHEINKPIIEKELLAIHWGINFFRPYLYGKKFYVVTDHRPLVSLFSHKNPSSKLTRMRIDLMDYDFEIKFKQGKMNTNADALSRIVIDSDKLKEMIPTTKINVITRGMINKEKINETPAQDTQDDFPMKPDQLHIWSCISMNDVKEMKRLYFKSNCAMDNNNLKNGQKFEISHLNNNVIIRCSDDLTSISGYKAKKLLPHLQKALLDLIISCEIKKIEELALASEDEIFKICEINEFKKLYNDIMNENKKNTLKIIIYTTPIQITNKNEINEIIRTYHESPYGGHIGIQRCINKIKQKYIWKNMRAMIKNYIAQCETCMRNKITKHTKEKLVITDTPTSSFETISIDTVGPLKISNGFRYILTLQDELTKFVEAFPIETKDATTIAKVLVEKFILKYGCFKKLKSDKGTEFNNELIKNICKILKIAHVTSTPFHHETLGALERNHRVLNEYLLSFTYEYNWDEWISYYTFCYNTTPHVDTGYSPFELVFGKVTYLPCDITQNIDKIYNLDDYVNEFKLKLAHAQNKARELVNMAKIKRKEKLDKNSKPSNFKIGDKVFLRNDNRKKSESPYQGPYKIVKQNTVNSTIKIGRLKNCTQQ